MCGRYASVAGRADLLECFVVDERNADELRGLDFNVTRTKDNPVVVIARVPEDAGDDADPVRELRAFRWRRVARSPQSRRRPTPGRDGATGRRQPRHVRGVHGRDNVKYNGPELLDPLPATKV